MEQRAAVETRLEVVPSQSLEERVRDLIERIRPYVQSHGGDVSVAGLEKGVLTLKVEGTCTHCPLVNLTYNKVVKTLIGKDVPEITKVVLT